jgi:NAD+-dependent protein deacetylase SIR2
MLAKELYPGKFRPTLTHSFVRLLASKSLLHTCFTQNIDTLERRAGVPAGKIIEAHGSFATQRCIECKRPYNDEKMKKAIKEGNIPRCENAQCKGTGKTRRNEFGEEENERGLVKPDIVFFGEGVSSPTDGNRNLSLRIHRSRKLPNEFHRAIPTLREADLLIVMGTSLTVRPFAMLAELVGEGCPRFVCSVITRHNN